MQSKSEKELEVASELKCPFLQKGIARMKEALKLYKQMIKCKYQIYQLIHDELSLQNKNLEVMFSGKTYDFYLPFTKEEFLQIKRMRKALATDVVEQTFILETDVYLRKFMSGADARQFEMKADMKTRTDEVKLDGDGNKISAIPLDLESWSLQTQMESVISGERSIMLPGFDVGEE